MSLPPPKDNYAGEPQYPAPWTTGRPKEGLRDTGEARIICLAPDVCLTPVGNSVVPIPYQIVDYCGDDQGYTPSVRFTGKKAMVLRSSTTCVHGDAPGTRKGVKSGTVEDICEPIGHATEVRAEGSNVIRHLDRFHMNAKNTVGEAIFVRDTATYQTPEDDDPVPGSLVLADSTGEGVVMSDASPEPLIMGAQYAQALPAQQPATAPSNPTIPGSSVPNTRPPTQLPPAANDNTPVRRGTFGKPRAGAGLRVLNLLGLATAGYALGDMAGQWYVGPDAVMGRAIADHLRSQVPFTSSQAPYIAGLPWHFGGDAHILNANDILSLKAGYAADYRTMDPAELEELLEAPWPSAEQLERNKRTSSQPRSEVLPQSETVRVTEREEYRKKCQVDRYAKMKTICGQYGMQAHHIVPDWTLRYGARDEGDKRIPNMPSLNDGQAICVMGNAREEETEHWSGHLADKAIEDIGKNSTPLYTAKLAQVRNESVNAMIKVRPDCAKQIVLAMAKQFAGNNPNQLLRAKQYPPLPYETLSALKTGAIAGANVKP
jgi:hypothetical protein